MVGRVRSVGRGVGFRVEVPRGVDKHTLHTLVHRISRAEFTHWRKLVPDVVVCMTFPQASGCGTDSSSPEDLLHFVWKCHAYDQIRDQFAPVFARRQCASPHVHQQQSTEGRCNVSVCAYGPVCF